MDASTPGPALMVYYPLIAAVGGMLFWSGVLSQRVRTLEREQAESKKDREGDGSVRDRLTRIETLMEGFQTRMGEFSRGMGGVQRQLANLMGKVPGGVYSLEDAASGGDA